MIEYFLLAKVFPKNLSENEGWSGCIAQNIKLELLHGVKVRFYSSQKRMACKLGAKVYMNAKVALSIKLLP